MSYEARRFSLGAAMQAGESLSLRALVAAPEEDVQMLVVALRRPPNGLARCETAMAVGRSTRLDRVGF